jgi:hypothetical protein
MATGFFNKMSYVSPPKFGNLKGFYDQVSGQLLQTPSFMTGIMTGVSNTPLSGLTTNGITASTGFFSVEVTAGTGSFGTVLAGNITGGHGCFLYPLTALGGTTGTTSYNSGIGIFGGGITATTGYFSNSLNVEGTGYFDGGLTATTGYFSNPLKVEGTGYFDGGLTGSTGYFGSGFVLYDFGVNTAPIGGTNGTIAVNSSGIWVNYGGSWTGVHWA